MKQLGVISNQTVNNMQLKLSTDDGKTLIGCYIPETAESLNIMCDLKELFTTAEEYLNDLGFQSDLGLCEDNA